MAKVRETKSRGSSSYHFHKSSTRAMSKLKRRSRASLTGRDKVKLINVSNLGNNIIVTPRPDVTYLIKTLEFRAAKS